MRLLQMLICCCCCCIVDFGWKCSIQVPVCLLLRCQVRTACCCVLTHFSLLLPAHQFAFYLRTGCCFALFFGDLLDSIELFIEALCRTIQFPALPNTYVIRCSILVLLYFIAFISEVIYDVIIILCGHPDKRKFTVPYCHILLPKAWDLVYMLPERHPMIDYCILQQFNYNCIYFYGYNFWHI